MSETWVINQEPEISSPTIITFTANFTSNETSFTNLNYLMVRGNGTLRYNDTTVYTYEDMEGEGVWANEVYRTVTFEASPTGDLLTWLQTNAVKQ